MSDELEGKLLKAKIELMTKSAFISTIVGAGAAFFGLYVGKSGASLPKGKK